MAGQGLQPANAFRLFNGRYRSESAGVGQAGHRDGQHGYTRERERDWGGGGKTLVPLLPVT